MVPGRASADLEVCFLHWETEQQLMFLFKVLLRACRLIKSHLIEELPRTKLHLWFLCLRIRLTKGITSAHLLGNRTQNLLAQTAWVGVHMGVNLE
jgi:hypothetical protein